MSSAIAISSALRFKFLEIIIKHQPMYQRNLINVHTAYNITLKHCDVLPLSRKFNSALVVCKQVIVLPVNLLGAHRTENVYPPGASESN